MDRRGFMKTIIAIGAGAALPTTALAKKPSSKGLVSPADISFEGEWEQQADLPYVIFRDNWCLIQEYRDLIDITNLADHPWRRYEPGRIFATGIFWGDDVLDIPTDKLVTIYLDKKGYAAILVGRIIPGIRFATNAWLFSGEIIKRWQDITTNDGRYVLSHQHYKKGMGSKTNKS